ncbi:MAG: methionine adenosyltransferase [Flavobacteriaceae bacterium]|nr:methionine adenosyltransferase [Flavobacteriaceae bacterium]|tara:strand:+ start:38308 stop:39561 length:1254 start_codon:yes stop_codon:yes gene_type:complete
MSYFFTSESVSEGHPDKVSDQISDALLDNFLAYDSSSKVACETLVTTGQVILSGEVKSNAIIDSKRIARDTINKIGYTKLEYKFSGNSCEVTSFIHEQSQDINRGVERIKKEDQGAGDQGLMFGYAINETKSFMPLTLDLSHKILIELADLRKNKRIKYLRPDAKSQVTIEYHDNNKPKRIDTIVISTQHDDFDNDENIMLNKIKSDLINILIPKLKKSLPKNIQDLFGDDINYHINPTGKFVIGGPHGDTGLTGRKIIVDTYGGKGGHGGGAFSGKDPSKVDRSAAYAARHMAKNLVASGISDELLVQVSYAIGVANPTSININTFGTSKINLSDQQIGLKLASIFDMRPYAIEQRLKLRNPIYFETSAYGHMGRKPQIINKTFHSEHSGKIVKEVELFTWEKLDFISKIKKTFKL